MKESNREIDPTNELGCNDDDWWMIEINPISISLAHGISENPDKRLKFVFVPRDRCQSVFSIMYTRISKTWKTVLRMNLCMLCYVSTFNNCYSTQIHANTKPIHRFIDFHLELIGNPIGFNICINELQMQFILSNKQCNFHSVKKPKIILQKN